MKTRRDGEIFERELMFVQSGNLGRKFEDARAPGDELLTDELIGALAAKISAPGKDDSAGTLFFLELLLHGCKEQLLVGVAVGGKTEQGHADRRDLVCHVGGLRTGSLKLILQQEALDLIVIDANGNDDGAESAIVSGEAAAHFLRGAIEMTKRKKSIDAGAD